MHKQYTPNCLHFTNAAIYKNHGHTIVLFDIENMIQIDTLRDWIAKQIVIKFGSLKIDKCGDRVMCYVYTVCIDDDLLYVV